MKFSESPLAIVAQDIRNAKNVGGFAHYGLVIHTPTGDVDVFRLLNIDTMGDFVNKYCEEKTITALVPTGAYKFKILQGIGQLEVSLQKRNYDPFSPGRILEDSIQLDRFTAQLINTDSDPIAQADVTPVNGATEDLASHTPVKLQLFDKVMEQFAMRTSGAIRRRTDVQSIIKTVLMGEASQADVDSVYAPGGVDMVEPKDVVLREHVIVPHTLPSKSVPQYIHEHCGGVYSAGLSYFYHSDMWYVYPTYDFKRFNEAKKQLTIVVVPAKAMSDQEFTMMQSGDSLTILATGDIVTSNPADKAQLQYGNGVRFTDPQAMTGDALVVAGNKATVAAGKSNSEFTTTQRANGFNKVTTSSNPITSNRLFELSKMAERDGKKMMLLWQNANPDLLIPGMQVKILYMQGDQVMEARAVLLGVETSVQYTGRTLVAGNYSCNAALMLHVDRNPE